MRHVSAVVALVVLAGSGVAAAGPGAGVSGVLLIPNSGTGFDNVWAFNAYDGSLISSGFIASDGRQNQVIQSIDSGRGSLLLVDELNDSVSEYSYGGQFIRTVVTAAASGIDQPFAIAVNSGRLFVSVVSGTHANTVQSFDLDGGDQRTFANLNGIGTPRGILFRGGDVLIGDSAGDDIERFSLTGQHLGTLVDSDGVTGIDFPQQLALGLNGSILAAGFTAPFGVYRYNSDGSGETLLSINTSPRGVYQLGNGNILWAGGTRVGVIDALTGQSTDVVNQANASFRFIDFTPLPSPGAAALLAMGGALAARRRRAAV
ncbi:MAG: hypothetical protein C0475_08535 [Planctomyces sp.]|nr:hypothetical protein [Planctomyces sp.]MBA4119969.1 hypothetical protein [Isosphaera sp.]